MAILAILNMTIDVCDDSAAIVDYFHQFLELKPKGTLNEIHVTCLGDDTAINQGIYTFDVVKGGATV